MLIPFDYLFKKHQIRPQGVLHLGANEGQEAEEYEKAKVPFVIWVEAIPSVYEKLVQRVRKYPTHICLCACVSDVDGKEVTFNVANNQGQSSSFLEFGTHAQEHPTVKFIDKLTLATSRVDTLLFAFQRNINHWFLNVDLQGAELLALKGMGHYLWGFDWAYIEVNEKELYKGCPLVGEIDAYLALHELKPAEVKMTGSGWGDKFYKRC